MDIAAEFTFAGVLTEFFSTRLGFLITDSIESKRPVNTFDSKYTNGTIYPRISVEKHRKLSLRLPLIS